MFRKFFRGIFTIIGGLIGYEVYELCSYLLKTVDPGQGQAGLSGTEEVWAISVCVIIFGIIFYRIAPILTRKSRKVADNIGTDLQGRFAERSDRRHDRPDSRAGYCVFTDTDLSERRQPEVAVSDDYDHHLCIFGIFGLGHRQQKRLGAFESLCQRTQSIAAG